MFSYDYKTEKYITIVEPSSGVDGYFLAHSPLIDPFKNGLFRRPTVFPFYISKVYSKIWNLTNHKAVT